MINTSVAAAETATNPIGLPWGEIVIAAVAFAVLLFVLGKFVWPMFESAYTARTKASQGRRGPERGQSRSGPVQPATRRCP